MQQDPQVVKNLLEATKTTGGTPVPLVRLRAHMIREVEVHFGAYALRPVTDCDCVAARRGGKQQEVNDQSAG